MPPNAAAWHRGSHVVSAANGSTVNGALLACQAREHGWMVITRDADFGVLRRSVSGLTVAAPSPVRP